MARISPFLQMLLGRKRPTEDIPSPVTPINEPSPTVPISARPSLNPPSVTPSTVPTGPTTAGLPPPAAPTLPIRPRPVDEAADVVRKYDQGLHPDPKTGEWVPHHRNKVLQTLEGLGNVAASGVGVNLQSILHPRGTPEQQARRRLGDEMGIEDQDLQRRGAEANIARDEAYGQHLKNIEGQAGIKLTPKAEKPAYAADREVAGEIVRPKADGSGYKVIYSPPPKPGKPEKAEKVVDVPDTAPALAELEGRFRKNEGSARAAAEKAEADAKAYIAQNPDKANDSNVVSLVAEAKRQRAYADDQRKRADDLAAKKVEAQNKTATARAKGGNKGQRWSKSRWAQANPNADINAAVQAAKSKGFEVVN